ncbi:MAG: glycosyltransferase [Treponema sp.]|nr:glycosyltransferase [Treponema sp.]
MGNSSIVLTVIVPFYNSKKYLEGFVAQLTNQINQNFLVIFIDNGSTDGSYEYCKQLIQDLPSFSLHHSTPSCCVGAARVCGINLCKTKYLTFFDVDDEISDDAIQRILNGIESDRESQIFIYEHRNRKNSLIENCCTNVSTVNKLFQESSPLINHLWNKVFKTELLKNIDLPYLSTLSFAEDLYACVHAFLISTKTTIVHKSYYTYVKNSASCTMQRSEKSFYDNARANEKLLELSELYENAAVKNYIQNDAFYCFGQFIFPNKKNSFQWKSPHYRQYRELPLDKVSTPTEISSFIRFYIYLIKRKFDFFAFLIWILLKIKQGLKNE